MTFSLMMCIHVLRIRGASCGYMTKICQAGDLSFSWYVVHVVGLRGVMEVSAYILRIRGTSSEVSCFHDVANSRGLLRVYDENMPGRGPLFFVMLWIRGASFEGSLVFMMLQIRGASFEGSLVFVMLWIRGTFSRGLLFS